MTLAMSWDEWARHDATALADRVRGGEVTPTELAAQAAAGIARVNPALSAVIEVFEDVIADPLRDGMDPGGPFAGVPYLMKDLGPTLRGRRQEMGSLLMRGHMAAADSYLTQRIRAAGLTIMGRTTTPEFGVCSSAENPALYVTRNPWNPDHTTCGSSAGTAAAVAAGAVPIAHATDGGGSIRIPAGACGNIGLKPSRGVFSVAPGGSDLTGIVSVQGCHTRTVRDTAAFVDACRGGAPGEFMPYWAADEPYVELIRRDPVRLRVALSHEWGEHRATPDVVAALERAGRLLEGLGHHVDWARPDVDFAAAYAAQTACYVTNFAQVIQQLLDQRGLDRPPPGLVEPMNVRIWEAGRGASYAERAGMQAAFNATSRGFGAFFEGWDVLLTPVMARPTPRIGDVQYLTTSDRASVADWFANLWGLFAYTPLANLCGLPGISLPLAVQDGLPLGIQAQARQAGDGLLLQLAAQVERALGGRWNEGGRPGVHVAAQDCGGGAAR